MGTRSIIAIPQGDSWKGRYCHWDGYPSYMLPTLRTLIERDGVDKVVETLVTGTHYGWSHLDPDYPAAISSDDSGYHDGRFEAVKGYGVAYTDTVIRTFGVGYQQAREDEWRVPDGDNFDIEWTYILSDKGITVLEGDSDLWRFVGHEDPLPVEVDA